MSSSLRSEALKKKRTACSAQMKRWKTVTSSSFPPPRSETIGEAYDSDYLCLRKETERVAHFQTNSWLPFSLFLFSFALSPPDSKLSFFFCISHISALPSSHSLCLPPMIKRKMDRISAHLMMLPLPDVSVGTCEKRNKTQRQVVRVMTLGGLRGLHWLTQIWL